MRVSSRLRSLRRKTNAGLRFLEDALAGTATPLNWLLVCATKIEFSFLNVNLMVPAIHPTIFSREETIWGSKRQNLHHGLSRMDDMAKDKSSPVESPRALEAGRIERAGNSDSIGRPLRPSEIGFVGLGHMGTAMAANLAIAGYRVIAYVRRPEQTSRLMSLGLQPTTDISQLFDCKVVISMLPDDAAARDVVLGRSELGC